ncbi:LpxI family protein [Oleidesulfovibrio sp.]|uniref:LpxI family protein n=1 Tax=Oleidesulfovibrio sp. TaxID=2909707 RepID=UPI003A84B600
MSHERIGIIAGSGQFPLLVARAARQEGHAVVMCGFYGHTDEALQAEVDEWKMLHLGQLNKLINYFLDNGVKRLCFAGAISKPRALDLRPDMRAATVLFKLRSKGDDVLLRAVLGELESEGLAIVQAAELVPGLLGPEGVLTKTQPSEDDWQDLRYGWPIAMQIGAMDIGQCVVVKRGMVVAVEGLEGTDATLRRGGDLGGEGCVALKIVKPGQDERIDLPALGLGTIRTLQQGGYSCLCYQAGKALFFDREESISLADRYGISIVGIGPALSEELTGNADRKL